MNVSNKKFEKIARRRAREEDEEKGASGEDGGFISEIDWMNAEANSLSAL